MAWEMKITHCRGQRSARLPPQMPSRKVGSTWAASTAPAQKDFPVSR